MPISLKYPIYIGDEVWYGCFVDGVLSNVKLMLPSEMALAPRCKHPTKPEYGDWKRLYVGPDELYDYVVEQFEALQAMTEADPWFENILTLEALLTGIAVGGILLLTAGAAATLGPELAAAMTALSAELTTIATALHLKTVLNIHNIAMLISEDYRKFWSDFYAELANVSKALGYDAYYLALVFRNSRTLIIDSATAMGYSYDEANMVWLDKFDKYLITFSKNAENYAENPEALFHDLSLYLEKEAVNDKTTFVAKLLTSISEVASVVDVTVRDLILIRDDLDKLIRDLPDNIESQIRPHVDGFFKHFDSFIDNDYYPAQVDLQKKLGLFGIELDKNAENVFKVVKRLAKPADYLLEIDAMDERDRLDQESKIADIVTRPLAAEAAAIQVAAKPSAMELKAIGDAARDRTDLPEWIVPEIKTPLRPPDKKAIPRETWFVGDY